MKKIAITCLFLLFCSLSVFAQSVAGLGAASGTVRDASGAVVPGATVVLSNESKGIKRTMLTTDAGVFSAPALVPASGYTIVVSKQGFANWEAKDFQIQIGQTVDLGIAMVVSSVSTQVEVVSDISLLDTTKSGVTQVVSQEEIDNLPINGRRADTFAMFSPAVSADGSFGLVSFRGAVAGNSFLTDGNDTTNSFYQENAGRTRISTQISQDAVQEFQVMSDGFSAEFGRAFGGVINTVTRSGTNAYHGTAYEFFRNRTLDAPDRYAAGYNAPEWRHQAGGTFGGPIKKDKLFFFSNFELVKRNFPGLNRIINTGLTDTGGNLNPALCTATAAQCAAAFSFVQKQMNVLVPRTVSSYMGFAKLDWHPNERNTFSFDMNAMHWRSPYGIQTQSVLANGNMIGNNGNSTVETRYGKASWTSIPTNHSVNEFRFGWFKDRLSDPASSDIWPSTGPLYISINSATVGAAQQYPRTFPSENRFQLVDNYSWTHGAHSAKFGYDYTTTEDWINQLSNQFGAYTYSTLTNFAKDFSSNTTAAKNYSTFTQTFGNAVQDFRTSDINLYAQDTWKVNKKLTLNYGIRYEYTFMPQPPLADQNYPASGKINSPAKDFAPRISLAYSLNDKTVLRAGYGIYYARFLGDGLQELLIVGPSKWQTSISVNPNQNGAPVFPNIVANAASVPSGTVKLAFGDSNFRNPYTQQGTLAVEHQFSKDITVTASYLWSHGVQFWSQRDVNMGAPGPVETYTIDDASGNKVGNWSTPVFIAGNKVDSRYSNIQVVENGGQTWYNALALQLRKRMSHGLSVAASYTWSHAIDNDNLSGAGSSGVLYFMQPNTSPGALGLDKGSSGTDQRHRAGITWMWRPTFTKSTSMAAKYLANGWELSTITTMASAQPTYASVSVSGQQFSNATMAFTSTLNGSGGWTRVPFWPVNNVDVDRVYRVDARLTRNIPINERIKATLMFEGFNVFNTQYNTSVQTTAFTASGGILKPVAGVGVGTASQGFPDGTNARRCQVGVRFVF